jgi:hypothetical protein
MSDSTDRRIAQTIFNDIKSDAHADIYEDIHIHEGFVDTIECAIARGRTEEREKWAKYAEHRAHCEIVGPGQPEFPFLVGHGECTCGLTDLQRMINGK